MARHITSNQNFEGVGSTIAAQRYGIEFGMGQIRVFSNFLFLSEWEQLSISDLIFGVEVVCQAKRSVACGYCKYLVRQLSEGNALFCFLPGFVLLLATFSLVSRREPRAQIIFHAEFEYEGSAWLQ